MGNDWGCPKPPLFFPHGTHQRPDIWPGRTLATRTIVPVPVTMIAFETSDGLTGGECGCDSQPLESRHDSGPRREGIIPCSSVVGPLRLQCADRQTPDGHHSPAAGEWVDSTCSRRSGIYEYGTLEGRVERSDGPPYCSERRRLVVPAGRVQVGLYNRWTPGTAAWRCAGVSWRCRSWAARCLRQRCARRHQLG